MLLLVFTFTQVVRDTVKYIGYDDSSKGGVGWEAVLECWSTEVLGRLRCRERFCISIMSI